LPTARSFAILKMPSKLQKNTMPRLFLTISQKVKIGGVCLKISERNWLGLAGGIPPTPPFRPPRLACPTDKREPERKGKLPKNLSKMSAQTL